MDVQQNTCLITPAQRLAKHKTRVNQCGQFSVLVQQSSAFGFTAVRHLVKCGSRFCPECSSIKKDKWVDRLTYFTTGVRCIMMTLTFPANSPDPQNFPAFYSKAWDVFLKKLRRRYSSFQYARFVELTKAGTPHFHVLIDRYIPQKYIKWAWNDSGGGFIVDIRSADPGRATHYVSKYVTKAYDGDSSHAEFFFLSRMRSVSTSRGLFSICPRSNVQFGVMFGSSDSINSVFNDYSNSENEYYKIYSSHEAHAPPIVYFVCPDYQGDFLDDLLENKITYNSIKAAKYNPSALPPVHNHVVYS